jgi:uncharacterized membrane protein YgcG
MNRFFLGILLFLFVRNPLIAQDQEEIIKYHSEISVQTDGSLKVTETIKVSSLGNEIRRGIYRSFPVKYRDQYNNQIRVGFEVLEVKKDGTNEPFEVIRQGDFEVIRIGDANTLLDPGIYTYTISYETNRQIGFFENFDELYWNAIGTEWVFPILDASARITLPPGGVMGQYAAYAGYKGSTDCLCDIIKESDRSLFVKVKGTLYPGEALTLAASWQKGLIEPPTRADKTKDFFRDNAGIFLLSIGLILVFLYYYYAWYKVGRDPYKGGIYPMFEPPEGLDAAASRYLYKMRFDSQTYVSAIVEMATLGLLKITEEKRKKYKLEKSADTAENSNPSYQKIMALLFPTGQQEISLDQKEHKKIGGAMRSLKNDLYFRLHGSHFKNNYMWIVPGILISGLSLVLALKYTIPNLLESEKGVLIAGIALSFVLLILLGKIVFTVMSFLDKGHANVRSLVVQGIFLVIFLAVPVYFIQDMNIQLPYGFLFAFLLLGLSNLIFIPLIKAPTVKGRKIMDAIEGFRMYLNAAEKPLLEMYNPPGITPEIFEKYLPYAIALDVGEAWGKAFEKKLDSIGENKNSRSGYYPHWYAGTAFTAGSLAGFSDTLNSSFGSALANSSSPPGSSSGSGGGGSSGGGGGGGGGGGW